MFTIKTEFKVADAMTKSPITVTKDTGVVECAELMKNQDVGSVLVLENGKLEGIVTEWDIVRKAVASGKNPSDLKVSNIMCTNVQTIAPDVDLFDAMNMMTELNIRHLPVVHEGEFIGFLTEKDILKIEPALFDILVQSFSIKEEDSKPIFGEYVGEKDYGDADDDED